MQSCWNPEGIIELYEAILFKDVTSSDDAEGMKKDIDTSINEILQAHKESSYNLIPISNRVSVDYNRKAVRCAYIHRFASLYTALSYELLCEGLWKEVGLVGILRARLESFKLCSLGGGPGTDVVGVWTALYHRFGRFFGSATVVDKMFGWDDTVNSVIRELQTGRYPVSQAFDPEIFQCSFLRADLLCDIPPRVQKRIGSADMVTMFKFLSAAACEDTEKMLQKIFDIMKPGALAFFINNASGGFHELVNRVAEKNKFSRVFGPLCHLIYHNERLNVFRFGSQSLWRTTVTVEILRKPDLSEILQF